MHRISDRRRVVQIGIVGIFELKGPTTAPDLRPIEASSPGALPVVVFQPANGRFF